MVSPSTQIRRYNISPKLTFRFVQARLANLSPFLMKILKAVKNRKILGRKSAKFQSLVPLHHLNVADPADPKWNFMLTKLMKPAVQCTI